MRTDYIQSAAVESCCYSNIMCEMYCSALMMKRWRILAGNLCWNCCYLYIVCKCTGRQSRRAIAAMEADINMITDCSVVIDRCF